MAVINSNDLTSVDQITQSASQIAQATADAFGTATGNASFVRNMDDGNYSLGVMSGTKNVAAIKSNPQVNLAGAYHSVGIYRDSEIDIYNKRYRWGIVNPSASVGTVREYLFFTKPDLNIYPRDDSYHNGVPSTQMAKYLKSQPFWVDMESRYPGVLRCLQSSLISNGVKDPFNHLLENMTQGNLEVPALSAEMIETPDNMYGVGYTYRGSSEAGNDTYNFSLEFKDTKFLEVYHFFAAYESYETLKHHGVLKPWSYYIFNKVLYDQYSIYKIMVDDDGETIIYLGKVYGVKSKSLPRDTFSNSSFDNGLSYSIDFEAAFYDDDMTKIAYEFNNLTRKFYNSMPYQVDIHNHILDRPDNRPAKAAYIAGLPGDKSYSGYELDNCKNSLHPGGRVLKLKWRGDDRY